MKGKWVLAVVAVAVLLVAGGGAFFFLSEEEKHAEESTQSILPYFVTLNNIVVNLRSQEQEIHYLQLEVAIQVASKKYQAELAQYHPVLRDALSDYFSTQYYEAMDDPGQREVLRKGALERIREVAKVHLHRQRVDDLFLTSMVIQ